MAVSGTNIHIAGEKTIFAYPQFGSLNAVQLASASGKHGAPGDENAIVVILDPKSKIFQQAILIYFDAIIVAVDENPQIANIPWPQNADDIAAPGYFDTDAPHRSIHVDVIAARNKETIAAERTTPPFPNDHREAVGFNF